MQDTIGHTHLKRLLQLRFAAVACQALAIAVAHAGLGIRLPIGPMAAVVAALAGLNLLSLWRLRRGGPVRPWELPAQLLADLAALTALLYFSGGFSNPFIFMFLLPLALGAAAQPGWSTVLLALAAVAGYSFLMVHHVPLAGLDAFPWLSAMDMHLAGMWVCFVISAGLLAYYVARTSHTMRQNERLLAEARERALRNEQLAMLGSVAAGTAHELGTPLATMALLVGEMEAAHGEGSAEQREQLSLLRTQVYRCKDAVNRLSGSAGTLQARSGGVRHLDDWLRDLLDRWQQRQPDITLHRDLPAPQAKAAPRLIVDQALDQAVTHLLDNAARVSPAIECRVRRDRDTLRLEVLDRGPGVPKALADRLGREPLPQHPEVRGLGLGLFLATSTVARLGGRLILQPRDGGGTRAVLTLPLAPLRLEDHDKEMPRHVPATPAAG